MTGEPPTIRELIQIWQQRADDLQSLVSRRDGQTATEALIKAAAIRQCIEELLTVERWGM